MEFSYAVLDEFNDTFKKFYDKQSAEYFIRNKPEFTIKKLKVKSLSETLAEFSAEYGDPPF